MLLMLDNYGLTKTGEDSGYRSPRIICCVDVLNCTLVINDYSDRL